MLYEFSRGNQVDGSPQVAVAKPGRLGARAQLHFAMQIMFLIANASGRVLGITCRLEVFFLLEE